MYSLHPRPLRTLYSIRGVNHIVRKSSKSTTSYQRPGPRLGPRPFLAPLYFLRITSQLLEILAMSTLST